MTTTDANIAAAPRRARSDSRTGPNFLVFFMFFTLCLPSFMISIPGMPDVARTTDFVGLMALLCYAWLGGKAGKGERYLLLFLGGMFAVSVVALLVLLALPQWAPSLQTRNMLYAVRTVFLFAPALLAFRMSASPYVMSKWGLRFALAGAAFTIFMCLAYAAGSTAFNAHQTLATASDKGEFELLVNRLGGIVGETGAFGFHANLVFQMAILFAFLGGRRRLAYVLLALFVPYMLFAFNYSQTRISIANGGIFMIVALLSRDLMRRIPAVVLILAGLALGIVAIWELVFSGLRIASLGQLDSNLLLRFQGVLSGDAGSAVNTSGRFEHWSNVVGMIAVNPIFGYGVRTTSTMLDHAIENFFLQGLADYGIVVFAMFIAFARWVWLQLRAEGVLREPRYLPERQAAAILRAILVASFIQWQFNDINTYFQAFPMLCLVTLLVIRRLEDVRAAHGAQRPIDW
ncbi:O-antigen ligase family protein [Rhodovulum sp. DZ06]|uniref:O-antigen ligase family protein n=1 Tax=Rhodovulum sp. DZ06 TaxID=3425126 RepID=UPI003D3510D5